MAEYRMRRALAGDGPLRAAAYYAGMLAGHYGFVSHRTDPCPSCGPVNDLHVHGLRAGCAELERLGYLPSGTAATAAALIDDFDGSLEELATVCAGILA